jgi:hypothetical protein
MLDQLISLIEREMASIEHSILSGSCPDYTVYREQVGQLVAYRISIDLARKAFTQDEDDE